MTAEDVASALVSLDMSLILGVVPVVVLWVYRSRRQLAEIDTWAEVQVIALPVVVVALGAYSAGAGLRAVVAASIAKLLIGLKFNSAALRTEAVSP